MVCVTLWERVDFRIINMRPKPSRMKYGQSQAEQKNSPLEQAWLVTHHYNLPLSRIFREKYVLSDNNKKITIRNVHLTVCSPVVYQAIFKGRHISAHT